MSKPAIEKIVFNVRGKKLELSSEEAKELKGILENLFGETKVVHEWHTYPYRPWTYGQYWGGSFQTYAASIGSTAGGNSYALPQGASQNVVNRALNDTPDTLYLSIGEPRQTA